MLNRFIVFVVLMVVVVICCDHSHRTIILSFRMQTLDETRTITVMRMIHCDSTYLPRKDDTVLLKKHNSWKLMMTVIYGHNYGRGHGANADEC